MKVAIDGLGIPQRGAPFLHYTDRWKDSTMMSPKDYASVLSDTVFALSPVGNSYASAGRDSGLGAFRTWEALLMGAIPVIENHTGMPGTNWQYLGRYGVLNTPLPIVKKDWSNLTEGAAALPLQSRCPPKPLGSGCISGTDNRFVAADSQYAEPLTRTYGAKAI